MTTLIKNIKRLKGTALCCVLVKRAWSRFSHLPYQYMLRHQSGNVALMYSTNSLNIDLFVPTAKHVFRVSSTDAEYCKSDTLQASTGQDKKTVAKCNTEGYTPPRKL